MYPISKNNIEWEGMHLNTAADVDYAFKLQKLLSEEMVTYQDGQITIRKIGIFEPNAKLWLQLMLMKLPGCSVVNTDIRFLIWENGSRHQDFFFNSYCPTLSNTRNTKTL